MKKLILSLSLITLAMMSVNAKKVEIETARTVASSFITAIPGFSATAELQEVYTRSTPSQEPAFYVFSPAGGKGYIIISAEDALTPILGYSSTGIYPTTIPNTNFEGFIQGYVDQVIYARERHLDANGPIAGAWQAYLSTPAIQHQPITTVDPLLICMWNQDSPYNAYCPEDAAGPGDHVYAGCVATAMSMIMQYYRYPIHGTGSHSYYLLDYGTLSANFANTFYNWDAMLNSLDGNSGMAINAVAELQYQCGVAVNMKYAPDGSSAYNETAINAIKNYFGYSSSAQLLYKSDYSNTAWENMIIQSLGEKKPLYYTGVSPDGGHAFVLDGYQQPVSGNLFHFNFGWSGSQNGYYALTDVNGFSSSQGMIRNFIPSGNYPSGCSSHTITSNIGTFEDGSGPLQNYVNNASCSWLIAPIDSVTSINLSFNLFDTENNTDIVTVYDGDSDNDPVLGVFSGTNLPSQVSSTGRYMLVTFTTNGANSAKGWQAQYVSTLPTYCEGTTMLTAASGAFSDGSGGNNCNNNLMCKWKIVPPGAQNVTLSFTAFDLEENGDQLLIYSTGNNQLLATYSGSSIPDPVTSATGGIMMLFKTNSFNQSGGFDAEYTIDNVEIKENSLFKQLGIFPNPSTGVVNVQFTLPQSQLMKINVTTLAGTQVFSANLGRVKGRIEHTLDLSLLSKGIYFLQITSESGTVYQKLILH